MQKWTLSTSHHNPKTEALMDHADQHVLIARTTHASVMGHVDRPALVDHADSLAIVPDENLEKPPRRLHWSIRGLRNFAVFVVWVFGLSVAWVMVDSFMPIPFTSLMGIRVIESVTSGKPIKFFKEWVSIDKINPALAAAVLAGEDTRFFEHNGFDFEAIHKAIEHNSLALEQSMVPGSGLTRAARSRLRGGSTISQQTAKNVFLWPSRSWVRKGVEVYFTALIELLWTKERILEVYLNVVEWGDGVYGAEAASELYFHKPAARLTAREAALLAAVLPNPRKFSVVRPTSYTLFREGTIRARMPITSEFIQAAQRK